MTGHYGHGALISWQHAASSWQLINWANPTLLPAVCCQLQAGSWISPWAAFKLTAFLFLGRIVPRDMLTY